MWKKLLFLPGLERYGDCSLLALRIGVGIFLVWGVIDNVVSVERMREFEQFLVNFGFAWPGFMAPLSVWAQFFIGLAFISGCLTRWAGVLCMINFIVAIIMVDSVGGLRGSFASGCLVAIGLYLATHGPGRFSVDRYLMSRL